MVLLYTRKIGRSSRRSLLSLPTQGKQACAPNLSDTSRPQNLIKSLRTTNLSPVQEGDRREGWRGREEERGGGADDEDSIQLRIFSSVTLPHFENHASATFVA